jgi:hypothetical protein
VLERETALDEWLTRNQRDTVHRLAIVSSDVAQRGDEAVTRIIARRDP